jgi:hypothetical protein
MDFVLESGNTCKLFAMKIKLSVSASMIAIALCLAALIGFTTTPFAQGQSTAGRTPSGASLKDQQGDTAKPIEPGVLGVMFYLDPNAHTITALPKEKWTAVGKGKPKGFASATAVGSVQFSGISSAFHIPVSDKSEFVFNIANPSSAKLYMCSQFEKKKFRQADVVAVTESGAFKKTVTQTPIDGVPVEISKYGESSYKLTAKSLTPGEYVILSGGDAFTFGVP